MSYKKQFMRNQHKSDFHLSSVMHKKNAQRILL